MHVCTHTHTCMLAHTHTCMLAHTHTHACLHTHTHTHACLHTHTCTCLHTHTPVGQLEEMSFERYFQRQQHVGWLSVPDRWENVQVKWGGQERNRNGFISHIVHSLFFQSESFCHQALLATLWNQLTNPVIIFILLLLPCLLCTNSKDSVDPDKRAAWWRKTILVTLKATFSNTL